MIDIPLSVIGATVSRGDILLSDFEDIDHKKFFVVIGISEEEEKICGFFFINSNINEKVFRDKQELWDLQYPIYAKDYPFLNHQSFINAANLQKRELSKIADGIKSGSVFIKGRLKEEHISDIIDAVRGSKVISKRDKELFFR